MPIRRRDLDQDSDDILEDICSLYRRGRSAFYTEFAPLAKRMRNVNTNRRLYEDQVQEGLPEHPIEGVIDLYTKRKKEEDRTWTLKWIKLGKVLGLVDPSKRDEDDMEAEEAAARKAKSGSSGGKRRERQDVEEEDEDGVDTQSRAPATSNTKGKAKQRPQPTPTVRKDRAEPRSASGSKPKGGPEPRKAAKPPAAGAPSSKSAAPPAPSKPTPPEATSSKPRSRTAPKPFKSKAIISDSDEEDVVIVNKPQSKAKGVFRDARDTADEAARESRDKRAAEREKAKAAAAAASDGGGDSEEPLEDGFSEDADGDVDNEEAAEDPNEPPLKQARRRIQARDDEKKITVFGACHPCIKTGVQCTFSKQRIRKANQNAKVVCDRCKQQKKKCVPGPGPEFSLETSFTEYEALLFPPQADGTIIRKGMDGEGAEVETVGDVLATLVKEQRILGERLTSLSEEVKGLRTGMGTGPQYGTGVAAAVSNLSAQLTQFKRDYVLSDAQTAAALDSVSGRLTLLTKQFEEENVSSTLATILATLEQINADETPRRRRRLDDNNDPDEDFQPRKMHAPKEDSDNDDDNGDNDDDLGNNNNADAHDVDSDMKSTSSEEDFVPKKSYPSTGGGGNDDDVEMKAKTPEEAETPAKDKEAPVDEVEETDALVDEVDKAQAVDQPEEEEAEPQVPEEEAEKEGEEAEGKDDDAGRLSEPKEAAPKGESRPRSRRGTRSKATAEQEDEPSGLDESPAAAATTTTVIKPAPSNKKRKATAPPDSDTAAIKKTRSGKNTSS